MRKNQSLKLNGTWTHPWESLASLFPPLRKGQGRLGDLVKLVFYRVLRLRQRDRS